MRSRLVNTLSETKWVAVSAALLLSALGFALVAAPAPRGQTVWRIFYFHVGIAWTMFLAFATTFVASILFLRRESPRWDMVAGASAEIGFVLATLVLVTGSIWARAAWNTWWTWDPRLITALVLWAIYAGYLSLRGEQMERSSAVYGVLAFVTVPLTYLSVELWWSVHPQPSNVTIEASILIGMLVAVAAMTSLYFLVLATRYRVGKAEKRLTDVKEGRHD